MYNLRIEKVPEGRGSKGLHFDKGGASGVAAVFVAINPVLESLPHTLPKIWMLILGE